MAKERRIVGKGSVRVLRGGPGQMVWSRRGGFLTTMAAFGGLSEESSSVVRLEIQALCNGCPARLPKVSCWDLENECASLPHPPAGSTSVSVLISLLLPFVSLSLLLTLEHSSKQQARNALFLLLYLKLYILHSTLSLFIIW